MSWVKGKEASTAGEAMKLKLSNRKKKQHDYYFDLIIDLMNGSHDMCSGVINLYPAKPFFGYYGIDDTVVYYDNEMRDALLREGIASYKNSSDGLVITTSEDRVNNLIEELKFRK